MAAIDINDYHKLYKESIDNPEQFWDSQARKYINWYKTWGKVTTHGFSEVTADNRWFPGAELNVSYNCLDRHLPALADKPALIWQNDDLTYSKTFTYSELTLEVCRFANYLRKQGVHKGDRVCLYLPMIPMAVVAMLACARIGAVHTVLYLVEQRY